MATWKSEELDPAEIYKLLVGSVVPRPIAWISSRSRHGINNIAPFSFFNVASRFPPMLAVSIGQPTDASKREKDTLGCIRDRGEYVVNICNEELLDGLVATSVELPGEIDEFSEAHLTPRRASVVDAPLILEAPISMECRLERLLPLGVDVLVVGEVVCFHIADRIRDSFRIAAEALRPVGRMAGPTFCTGLNTVTKTPEVAARRMPLRPLLPGGSMSGLPDDASAQRPEGRG